MFGALVNGCLNVMRYLKMLPGSASVIEHPVWLEKSRDARERSDGNLLSTGPPRHVR